MGYTQCKECPHDLTCVRQLNDDVPDGSCPTFEKWDGKPIELKKTEHYYCTYWGCDKPLILVKTKLPKKRGKDEVRIYKCPTCGQWWRWHGDDYFMSSMISIEPRKRGR